ncbi:MAG: FISUMP domain-containing protein [Fibrobacter sp.]|nr:FISUMP domain-containing protein [Fibrobacter sp.]
MRENTAKSWTREITRYTRPSEYPTKSGLRKNLDYPVEGRYSYCYDMDSTNCETHGYLYRWDTAINIDQCEYGVICDPPERTQGVRPAGWHIPSAKEWLDLFSNTINNGRVKSSAIGNNLKSSKGWNSGTHKDIYGFSAIPSGSMGGIGPGSGLGEYSGMWSSDEQGTYGAYMVSLDVERSTAWLYDESKALFLSIRCLMDSDIDPTDTTSFTGSSKQPTLNKVIQEGISVEDYMNSQVDYGTLTDKHDGQVYKITKIGYQWWMAENLKYADSIKTPSLVNGSWCYDDNDQRCLQTGRLYTWAAAIDSVKLENSSLKCGFGTSCNIPDRVQGICPEGWHLPNQTEWNDLVNKLGGNKVAGHILKAQSGWGSSNTTHFQCVA